MATQFSIFTRSTPRAASMQPKCRYPHGAFSVEPLRPSLKNWRIKVSDGRGSYLDNWKKAVEREKQETEFQKIVENVDEEEDNGETEEVLEKKSGEFQKLLEVSPEERDRVQRMQVIDRAAAAIAATQAILKEDKEEESPLEIEGDDDVQGSLVPLDLEHELEAKRSREISVPVPGNEGKITPGPNFWSWTPPEDNVMISDYQGKSESTGITSPSISHINPVMELERDADILSIPFESKLVNVHNPPLPPLQSIARLEKVKMSSSTPETPHVEVEREIDIIFSDNAVEAANALIEIEIESPEGNNPDGSRWWKETGTEVRPDGVVCRWTVKRGVSADKAIEWEEKYWEAADDFDYKELGSEKSGRDSTGNVWREFWKESMYQKDGSLHLEKTADKWGKNGEGTEWQEKWWESYGASGQAEKWAHKWCSIDPNTSLEAGHAHIWHERWGEQYDGKGGSTKYTDKWADRCEGESWTKWGDKWDEHFDTKGHGVKQGETWWKGKHGECWNKTWGEGHNGSGWVHKYGKSSSGEHWDTHEEQDTWYEKFPHYGFYHCFENSVQLRDVKKPSE